VRPFLILSVFILAACAVPQVSPAVETQVSASAPEAVVEYAQTMIVCKEAGIIAFEEAAKADVGMIPDAMVFALNIGECAYSGAEKRFYIALIEKVSTFTASDGRGVEVWRIEMEDGPQFPLFAWRISRDPASTSPRMDYREGQDA